MYNTDFHIHTEFSFDSEAKLEDICQAAIDRGLNEIAITDHLDIYANQPFNYMLDIDSLYGQLDKMNDLYQDKLIIRYGAELGQPQRNPEATQDFYACCMPDFIIGSIHNMENDEDIYDYDWKNLDHKAFYHKYLDWELELARDYDYDVLGHITYPLRCMYEANPVTFDLTDYEERFREIFKIVIERGRGIECNTSGLLQDLGECLPRLEVLKLYKECGGEIITIGSDAHIPERVGLTIPQGIELIKAAGFEYVCTYQNRQPIFHKL